MLNEQNDEWMTRKEAAKYTKFAYSSFAAWDSTKKYNLYPKKGRTGRIRYRKSVLDRFMIEKELSPK